MTSVIKLVSNTVTLGTSNNNVNSARLVRILNTAATAALITQFDTVANVQIGTYVMAANSDIVLEKASTDALTSNNAATVLAVGIGYRY